MNTTELRNAVVTKVLEYELGRITLSSLLATIEYLMFEYGGEEAYGSVQDTLSKIEDMNAASAPSGYQLSAAAKNDVLTQLKSLCINLPNHSAMSRDGDDTPHAD